MQVRELGVVEEGLERLARGPLDQDHDAAGLGVARQGVVQPPERHDAPAVLRHGLGRAARVGR